MERSNTILTSTFQNNTIDSLKKKTVITIVIAVFLLVQKGNIYLEVFLNSWMRFAAYDSCDKIIKYFVTFCCFVRLIYRKGGEETLDKEMFEKMYQTYYMQVYSFVMSFAGNCTLAEEITQETFYKAMTAVKAKYKGQSSEFTWLCSIARNLFNDEMRKRKKITEMPEDMASDDDFVSKTQDADTAFRIHCILHNLEEPYREVFQLRVFGELSFKQISQIFGKTESWARVTYHRAQLKIQERME